MYQWREDGKTIIVGKFIFMAAKTKLKEGCNKRNTG
jgi:hypothetical protein